MGFGILQHLTVVLNKDINFIWKNLLSIFEDIIFYRKGDNYFTSKFLPYSLKHAA